jgi:LysM repeat protein
MVSFSNLLRMPIPRWVPLFFASTATAFAQGDPGQTDVANLQEDVRGLIQRVNDLGLRVEQLEHENSQLHQQTEDAGKNYATLAQLNEASTELTRTLEAAIATSKDETLQQVAAQMEKLAEQTNAALDSLAKGQGGRVSTPSAVVATSSSGSYPKEGVSYTVQKGDTLALISKKTGARLTDIVEANKIADPSRIQIGQTLFIPGGK